nr:vWA domain-containing protein [Hyphomonas sp. Mor2]
MGHSHRAARALLTTLGLVGLTAAPLAQAEEQDVILVLDGSGSMWGQIEGEAKITIARSVVGQVIDDLPGDQRLGLVAYGHNRKGDCSDIEEVVTVGTDRDAVRSAVNAINPKGKTPLSASVQFAAEQLRYTENKATVILVSDGRETCDLDPCAVGNALEQAGVDFTAHVIGFDVVEQADQEQLQCLADNTGGTYLNASSAEELSSALEQTVAEVPVQDPITETRMVLRATDLAQGPEIEAGLTWRIAQSGGGEEVFNVSDAGRSEIEVAPGVYDVFVEWPERGLSGSAETVQVAQSIEKTVTIALEQTFEATLRTEPEGAAPVSSDLVVYWTGPERQSDWITITQIDGSPSSYKTYKYVEQGGNPLELRMPSEPGTYELRYVLGRPARVLASMQIEATPVGASMDAPDTVAAGAMFNVGWDGPGYNDDWVTVVAPDAADRAYTDYAYTREGEVLELRAPLEPGEYELRYVQAGQEVIARRALTVTAVEASMDAPDTVEVGTYHQIGWTGPAGQNDWLTIVRPGEAANRYTDYAYTREGDVLTLRMPLEPGNWELRYVQNGRKVLAVKEMQVTDRTVPLVAVDNAVVGNAVEVGFDGIANKDDWLTVAAPDAAENRYTDYEYARNGSPASIKMPVEPGTYELRYVLDGRRVIGRKEIVVEDADASVSGPASVTRQQSFSVDWSGPGNHNDWITIVAPDAADTRYGDYAYTREGNPVLLKAPSEPGTYELRYVLDNKRVIARTAITVD